MTVTTNYLVTGNGITGSTANAVQALVSGAWNAASSGTWRPAALGALPRFSVSGGASGGTWALSYRNAAGTVTSDPADTVAAGVVEAVGVGLPDQGPGVVVEADRVPLVARGRYAGIRAPPAVGVRDRDTAIRERAECGRMHTVGPDR